MEKSLQLCIYLVKSCQGIRVRGGRYMFWVSSLIIFTIIIILLDVRTLVHVHLTVIARSDSFPFVISIAKCFKDRRVHRLHDFRKVHWSAIEEKGLHENVKALFEWPAPIGKDADKQTEAVSIRNDWGVEDVYSTGEAIQAYRWRRGVVNLESGPEVWGDPALQVLLESLHKPFCKEDLQTLVEQELYRGLEPW